MSVIKNDKNKKAFLVLENNEVFEGHYFGKIGEVSGEIVFDTNMTGFQESLTNPKNENKLLVQTFPIIGNVGVNNENSLSEKNAAALIVREYCDEPSNFRSEGTLGEFMKKQGIIGLMGIDTRRLVHILRDNGTTKARITGEKPL